MQAPLTKRQQNIYNYLKEHQDLFDYPPTLDELCKALGLSSRGSLHKHIQALIKAGLIEPMDGRQRGIRLTGEDEPDLYQLPLLGYIAAGQPIEALENPQMIEVPAVLKTDKRCYVLQVQGESMIDEGILDGDWVIIEQRNTARNGEIVVALIDGYDATLKRIEQHPNRIILHPANASMKPIRCRPEQVEIQGVLVGQMRQY